jgi:hypothetical protein
MQHDFRLLHTLIFRIVAVDANKTAMCCAVLHETPMAETEMETLSLETETFTKLYETTRW